MKTKNTKRSLAAEPFCLLLSLLMLPATSTFAQTAPDAGRLLREQPKPPAAVPAPPASVAPAVPEEAAQAEGPKVLVKGFRIKGAVLIPEAELAAQLQGSVGKELTLDQIRAAGLLLTVYYMQKGYLARVVVPPQDIKDGIVEIQVIEGKRGALNLDKEGERIDAVRAQQFIERRLPEGAPMNLAQLGEALNILNEQPGIEAKASIAPGKKESEIDLNVKATGQPLARASLGLNNQGSYGTGEAQASGGVTFNNPTGNFDALSLLLNLSQGSSFLRGDYSVAAGSSGLRLGVNASHLNYHLVPSSFAALQSKGTANTAGITASYPLRRRTDSNLSLTGSYDEKCMVDQTVTGETGNRRVNTLNLGLNGYTLSSLLGGGVASFGANYVAGKSDQRNAAALATDSTTRQVQGNFGKFGYNLGWLSSLPAGWNLNAALHGQIAGKNLDSSEQMNLGGANGVRAYPTIEASGDDGWLLNLDFGKPINDSLTAHLFLDAGGITLNHSTWANWNAANPNLPNNYTLSGAGVGLDWRITPSALLTASIAAPFGNNRGADANGKNVDGYGNRARAWITLNATF